MLHAKLSNLQVFFVDFSYFLTVDFILDYSMVTSISPLETLHNSLTLEQMDRFLDKMIESDQLGGSAAASDKE